MVEILL